MKKFMFFLLIGIIVSACSFLEPEGSDMYEAVMPIFTDEAETSVFLDGFFKDVNDIESVKIEGYQVRLSNDKKYLYLTSGSEVKKLAKLKIKTEDEEYTLIVLNRSKIKKLFIFDPQEKRPKTVQITGSFSNWNAEGYDLEEVNGKWQIELQLSPGKYPYQLVIDGKQDLDPTNPVKESNNLGGFNSVMIIKDPAINALKIYTKEVKNNQLFIGYKGELDGVVALIENKELQANIFKDGIVVDLPQNIGDYKKAKVRVWAQNRFGVSNDLLIPFKNGNLVEHPVQIDRFDKHAQILYFMLVDRFCNGNKEIDEPIDDPEIEFKANYQGGDLAGIQSKLDDGYFEDLGINMLWLSPIIQNPKGGYIEYPEPHRKYSGYHGYWPVTFTTIDYRFGKGKDLHGIVESSHEKGINVILDFVSNHVHQESKFIQDHPNWKTLLDLPDGRKNIRIWDEYRLTTWFDTFLPSLNLEIPEVVDMVSDSAKFWLDEYNIDGFRHDATKHIPVKYWQTLTKKIRRDYSDDFVYQIGETFGTRELIRSYVGTDQLDGQFDFELYWDVRNAFAFDDYSFLNLDRSIKESLKYYSSHSLMGNPTGNHDLPRFISFASGALRLDEDDKAAGWERDIEVKDPVGYKKLSALTAFIMTFPGIPVIYYGDEIGMPGAGDPDNRRMMKFDGLTADEQQVRDNAKKLISVRKSNVALIYGDFTMLEATENTMIFARQYFGQVVLVAFNKSGSAKTISVKLPDYLKAEKWTSNFGADALVNGDEFSVTLQPYSFEILTN